MAVRLVISLATIGTLCIHFAAPGAGGQSEERNPAPRTADACQAAKLRLFAPAWRNIGEQTPEECAKKFTVIFGHLDPKPFHQGNPEIKCFKYVLGPYVAKGMLKVLPPEAIAHGREGNVVKARSWSNWLIVPDNPRWLDTMTSVTRRLMDSDFDGLFTDSMGTAPVDSNYVITKAVNPNTNKPYTKGEWIEAECVMLGAVREALPKGKLLILNGLGHGERYWTEPESDSPRPLLQYVDGAMAEMIWRMPNSRLTDWPSPERWMKDVRMIQDVEKRGLMGFWWTKCWSDGNTSNNEPNADKLVPQWRRFALVSYLLAAGPHSYFNFDTMKNDKPKSNAAEYFPEYDTTPGEATGPMEELGKSGVYGRPFSNGAVVVNPTDKPVKGARLPWTDLEEKGGSFVIAGGGAAKMTLDVPAHAGLILTLSGKSR